jgi:hypothetical protein
VLNFTPDKQLEHRSVRAVSDTEANGVTCFCSIAFAAARALDWGVPVLQNRMITYKN